MKSETRRKIIHYKRAVLTKNHVTLQNLLDEALKAGSNAEKALNRREVINPDDESFRLINHHKNYSGMFFGQLIFFEAGRSQRLITLDDDADYYKIDAITSDAIGKQGNEQKSTEEDVKKRREFIDSMLYFGVLDNHIVVMQSAALKSRELETHLSWFLGTCTELINKNSALILQDKPTEDSIKKIEQFPVKSVHLGTSVETRAEQEDVAKKSADNRDSKTDSMARKVKWIPCGMGVDVIQAALGEDWFNQLNLQDSLDDANLQVSLEISYLRRTTSNGQKMLDNIASSLRHIDEADVKIELYGGGTIQGNELKLSGPVSVKTLNGLVDENDLYNQMHTWLVAKIVADEIET